MTSDDNRQVVERLYSHFAAGNGAAMAAMYAPDATFSDPVFGVLNAERVGTMWKMLLSRADDLSITTGVVSADAYGAGVDWVADYAFGPKRRRVHNEVSARFVISDGLIRDHRDTFSFPRWARQALGLPGLLLGHTGYLQRSVQRRVLGQLERYSAVS